MSEPKGRGRGPERPGESWERRAADLANEVQRWLIKQSARNMRDELGDQVKKAFRGQGEPPPGDVWSTATTEPQDAADQPPECAWCPICRAARRMTQAQGGQGAATTPGAAAPKDAAAGLAGAADVLFGAARDALVGLDAILSYRPSEPGADEAAAKPAADGAASDRQKEPDHEPDHRS